MFGILLKPGSCVEKRKKRKEEKHNAVIRRTERRRKTFLSKRTTCAFQSNERIERTRKDDRREAPGSKTF